MDILLLRTTDSNQTNSIAETVKNQSSDSGCEGSNNEKSVEDTTASVTSIVIGQTDTVTKVTEEADDIVILRRDPKGKRNFINKSAYVKLHRAVSPEKNRVYVGTIKERYEGKSDNEIDTKLDQPYSPSTFGVPRHNHVSPRLPVAKPRSKVKSQIIIPSKKLSDKDNLRYSLQIEKDSINKDENSNEILNSSSSGEFITIITRSESEGSIDKFEKELSLFTMESKPKEKKRNNSFRKIFSGKIFGKDKKKKNEEELPKMAYRENVSNSVNMQNESNSFNRQATYRHTTGSLGSIPRETKVTRHSEQLMRDPYKVKELEERYARMHVQEFNHIKQNFENQRPQPPPVDYVPMDKPLINTAGPTYTKYIDTSSSASTAESESNNVYQNEVLTNNTRRRDSRGPLIVAYRDKSRDRSRERSRERNTPSRAQDIRQDVRLVNPKALIPINSERALPIPYQSRNSSSLEKPKISSKPNLTDMLKKNESNRQPHFEETYGIVFDSLEKQQQRNNLIKSESVNSIKDPKIPQSPTKLKLPPNREIVPLSPRVTSPIPHDNVSTDKVIATELLKPRSPSPCKKILNSRSLSPSHQKLEIGIDYPDNVNKELNERNIVTSKPPLSKIPVHRNTDSLSPSRQRLSQYSPAFDKIPNRSSPAFDDNKLRNRMSQASPIVELEKGTTSVVIHANSNTRTPTPNSVTQNRSMSPISITPVDMRPSSVSSLSPQKEDMRRSVEAFYWREIKKLKEQENMDLYYYQMNMMPFGYAEEPISTRRSRSLSPSSHRNSRRSLSLPRDPKPTSVDNYGRIQSHAIPEGRAVFNQAHFQHQQNYYQQNFRRNVAERQTLDNAQNMNGSYNSNSLYRPIFKRGSLTTPVKEVDDQQNKKVSFSSNKPIPQNVQAWPTRNGYAQNPPQRNRNFSLEDDVFLAEQKQNAAKICVDGREMYGYTNRPMNAGMYGQHQIPQQLMYAPNYPNVQYRQQFPQESMYGVAHNPNVRFRTQEELYGQPRDAVRAPYALTRHGSMQLPERPQLFRKMSYDNTQMVGQPRPQMFTAQPMPRREIIVKDEIFGQFGGYIPNEDPYGYSQRPAESLYGYSQQQKPVAVNNRVCDMYGQIHDGNSPSLAKNSGVLMGQMRNSPQVTRHLSYENFQRNTRLTASANDMYRRYPRNDFASQNNRIQQKQQQLRHQQEITAPSRPLPPVPMDKQAVYGAENDAGIASDVQSNVSSGKPKKRFFFGAKNRCSSSLETAETKILSTPELQRLVLLEQFHLIRMQRKLDQEKAIK